MLQDKMLSRLNQQINAELYSSYLYLSMATHFRAQGFDGFATWMEMQAREEAGHAMRIYGYINEHGGKVDLYAINQPPHTFDSPLSIFEQSLGHEKEITGNIHGLVELAIELKDHATHSFLTWFVNEQVEEESTADNIVQKLKLIGQQGPGLFILDKELGSRSTGSD